MNRKVKLGDTVEFSVGRGKSKGVVVNVDDKRVSIRMPSGSMIRRNVVSVKVVSEVDNRGDDIATSTT